MQKDEEMGVFLDQWFSNLTIIRISPEGLLKHTAEPHRTISDSVALGQAQGFSNKISGDAEVAGLGTQLGNHSLRHTSEQPLGFREIALALRTFEKKLVHLREYD